MNEEQLFDLLIKAKSDDKNALLKIISRFEAKIKKSLHQTSIQNRDDLKQELIIKFIEVIQNYDHTANRTHLWSLIRIYCLS